MTSQYSDPYTPETSDPNPNTPTLRPCIPQVPCPPSPPSEVPGDFGGGYGAGPPISLPSGHWGKSPAGPGWTQLMAAAPQIRGAAPKHGVPSPLLILSLLLLLFPGIAWGGLGLGVSGVSGFEFGSGCFYGFRSVGVRVLGGLKNPERLRVRIWGSQESQGSPGLGLGVSGVPGPEGLGQEVSEVSGISGFGSGSFRVSRVSFLGSQGS